MNLQETIKKVTTSPTFDRFAKMVLAGTASLVASNFVENAYDKYIIERRGDIPPTP